MKEIIFDAIKREIVWREDEVERCQQKVEQYEKEIFVRRTAIQDFETEIKELNEALQKVKDLL